MSTFNLVGFFARKTRSHVNGPVHEHPQEAVALITGISPAEAALHGGDHWEREADKRAVLYAKRTDKETKWMVDWQLVEVSEHQHKKVA
jgi:hypothetical protein